MPIKITDLDNGLGVLIKGTDIITAEQYLEEISKHLSQPEEKFKKYIYSISDYIEVSGSNINLGNIHKIASQSIKAAKKNPGAIVGIVVNSEKLYGMAKIWSALSKLTGWKINVFREREELNKWLNKEIQNTHGDIALEFDRNI